MAVLLLRESMKLWLFLVLFQVVDVKTAKYFAISKSIDNDVNLVWDKTRLNLDRSFFLSE